MERDISNICRAKKHQHDQDHRMQFHLYDLDMDTRLLKRNKKYNQIPDSFPYIIFVGQ